MTAAATPFYPESREREISGVVTDAGRPVRGTEIVLENADGGRGAGRVVMAQIRVEVIADRVFRARVGRGAVLMVGSMVLFSLVSVGVKLSARTMPDGAIIRPPPNTAA